jgi:hypothetical protein
MIATTPDAPLVRSDPEPLWALQEPRPGTAKARCSLCKVRDGYELIIENRDGALRWGYHSLVAAHLGATRMRTRLLASGWVDSDPG